LLELGYNGFMKRKILLVLLLVSISFSALHSFAIAALDSHACQVSEYLHDTDGELSLEVQNDGDICHIDHLFHIAFILPSVDISLQASIFSQKPLFYEDMYEYSSYDNFLKPPICS